MAGSHRSCILLPYIGYSIGNAPSAFASGSTWHCTDHSRIDLCENGNAFPPRISLTEDSSTPLNSQKLISQDEDWFAVDSGDTSLHRNAEDLVRAYHNFYHAAKFRSMASLHVTPGAASTHSRAWLLRPVKYGTSLHGLLSSTSVGIIRATVPTLYLNIVLWHYRHHYNASQSNTEELAQFQCIMQKTHLAKSVVALVWILVTHPDTKRIQHPRSAWLLNRLLRVESRLSIHLQHTLKKTSVEFLLTDEIENLESSWLTPEQFRAAVMTNLSFEDG